jgi:hypothetical protein
MSEEECTCGVSKSKHRLSRSAEHCADVLRRATKLSQWNNHDGRQDVEQRGSESKCGS